MTKSWKEIRFISDQVGQLLAFYTEKPVRIRQIAVFCVKNCFKRMKIKQDEAGVGQKLYRTGPKFSFLGQEV